MHDLESKTTPLLEDCIVIGVRHRGGGERFRHGGAGQLAQVEPPDF